MSNHYAIEMSMMLYQGDAWKVAFTYYNHGLEPPYGGIKSGALSEDFVMTLDEFKENVKIVDEFLHKVISVVKSIKPIPYDAVPDAPLEYDIAHNGASINYSMIMESMDLDVVYSGGNVTFKARDAYDVSWRGFVFFQETMEAFLAEIEK